MRFVCSFAWADLRVTDAERAFVMDLAHRAHLSQHDQQLVADWLDSPPAEDDLDPFDIPDAHRKMVLEAALEMMAADGEISRLEVESYALFETLLASLPDEDDDAPSGGAPG
jgi:hypothetical protein